MPEDIKIDIESNDLVFEDWKPDNVYEAEWVPEVGDSSIDNNCTVYEITVPFGGVYTDMIVHFPYAPSYKHIIVRIKLEDASGDFKYALNTAVATSHIYWYVFIRVTDTGSQIATIGDMLMLNGEYVRFLLREDYPDRFYAFSATPTELKMDECVYQNANMLLSCVPGNNYRYPTSGVGLVQWVNGNLGNDKFLDRLTKEFKNDYMTVSSASYNYDTQQLEMDVKFNSEAF